VFVYREKEKKKEGSREKKSERELERERERERSRDGERLREGESCHGNRGITKFGKGEGLSKERCGL